MPSPRVQLARRPAVRALASAAPTSVGFGAYRPGRIRNATATRIRAFAETGPRRCETASASPSVTGAGAVALASVPAPAASATASPAAASSFVGIERRLQRLVLAFTLVMTLRRAKAKVVDGNREDRRDDRGADQNERLRAH